MIRSFADKETEKIFNERFSKRLPTDIQSRALRCLRYLDKARSLGDLNSPALALEKLKGDRQGQWSIRINNQWRVCFVFESGDMFDIGITDYH